MCGVDVQSAPIGKLIKRARERKRMSQAEAAAALKVSRSALNAWENDRAYPRSSIGAIEELYGIVIDGDPVPQSAVPPSLLRAIAEADDLTDEEKVAVIAAVDETLARERGERTPSASRTAAERRRPAS